LHPPDKILPGGKICAQERLTLQFCLTQEGTNILGYLQAVVHKGTNVVWRRDSQKYTGLGAQKHTKFGLPLQKLCKHPRRRSRSSCAQKPPIGGGSRI